MAVTRRRFGMLMGAAAAGILGGAAWLADRLRCRRMVRAIQARRFPGRLRAMDEREIWSQGRWAG